MNKEIENIGSLGALCALKIIYINGEMLNEYDFLGENMSNKNENQNENLNKFYDALDNVIKTGRADGNQETLASTTTSQTIGTATTVGTATIASNSNMQYGWVCPKCGKVHAPWKDSCDCYLNIPYMPPNTPSPGPFNSMSSWSQAPEVGDAPG